MAHPPSGLTEAELQRFRDVEEKQKRLHEWLRSRSLAPDEARAVSCRSQADFVQFWSSISGDAQTKYDARHKKGWRLWSKRYQTFSGGVISFMKDMEPLLDIVKAFGVPYTGAAVGTITGLFVFAGRKTIMEGKISSALEGVKDRLPGFKMYEYIYRAETELETDLRKKILFAYLAFIDLSIEITKYYFRPAIYRWMIASFNSNKFDEMTENVFDLVVAIRMRCEELLSRNISEIKEQNEELLRDKNISHVMEIQKLLGLESWTPEAHNETLLKYKLQLNDECVQEVNYEHVSVDSNLWRSVSNDWEATGQSQLLLLVGVNNENVAQGKRYNWISPLALDIADRFASANGLAAPIALYVFRPDYWSRSSIHTALSVVLLQLLRHRQTALGQGFSDHREGLMAAVHRFAAAQTSEDENDEDDGKIDALRDLAVRVVSLYDDNTTVYIVLDRVDMCRDRDHYELIRILSTVIQKARCTIKVLAVADPAGWKVNAKSMALPNASQVRVLELRQRMRYDWDY
ncbi:hypothetical protein A1O1_07551 [Capronia coronata CBS 617.96]|uniref:Nephrocystin 3-like N-terminal domain-containing protein n=1 Tax=Capronia coronata CBS 617.96 TaxID=1182541 RepID=W9XTQ8_9EURO|nr:uncharacterized protein A1O1_07551 [Capronia coronata CBS 617.96]EXJ83922.1 hypothetical protein A1O1_07551 [Capronia coronata CBS 617.96]